jgi:CO/xanthine dehydrogenase FAD-binding subunit
LLKGETPNAELVRAAADTAGTEDVDPSSDIHASAAYRRRLVRVLTRQALERSVERAHAWAS